MNPYFRILPPTLLLLLCISCNNKKTDTEKYAPGNYFSVYQYALDSWNTYKGPPFLILKTVRVNGGKTDSSYTNSDTINWAPIFLTFFATDISARRFLDQYQVSSFEDNQDNTINLFYRAKDPETFTQKLLLTFDRDTRAVRGIYIETYEKTAFNETTSKLYYAPLKTIQIQTDNIPAIGARKHTVQQWDFMM